MTLNSEHRSSQVGSPLRGAAPPDHASLARIARESLGDAVDATVRRYRGWHDEARGGDAATRKSRYAELVNAYYDLATDFYEYGWGRSFHFAPVAEGESFEAAMLRHEHAIALRLGLDAGMRVVDVGCGVGGPMRALARFSGANIVGVNNNAYQVKRARSYNQHAGLEPQLEVACCDFMHLPMPAESFDAAYAIEATCHAPDLCAVYSEIRRVLKPGRCFAGYEWCLTDRYDPGKAEHREAKKGIEEGCGLPDLQTSQSVITALEGAGYEIVESRDLACTAAPATPWYDSLRGSYRDLRGARRTGLGRAFSHTLVRTLEALKVAPKGATSISVVLNIAADALVRAGELGIFTPMFFFLARVPLADSRLA